MKHGTLFTGLVRALVAGSCIATLLTPRPARTCSGTGPIVCRINPTACTKTMVLAKSIPVGTAVLSAGGATVPVCVTLMINCPATNNCGNACPGPGGPVAASVTLSLYPAPCPPVLPLPPATASITFSTAMGTLPMPTCAPPGPASTLYMLGLPVPAATPFGAYCVVGTATVTFSDGTVLSQTGDSVVCVVEPAPGRPGVPRLGLELISESFPHMAAGDQTLARYRVVNNDPSNSVTLTAFATSRQAAVRPQGGNEAQGIFSIASPFGDDFPIMFNPGTNCIPLPPHPYTQIEATNALPVLGPGQSNIITVGIRSYGQCADGSCSESTLRVSGTFSDGRPALACAGMTLFVDNSRPSQNWASSVNDCNQNGIPDALDIAARRSADANFNALPDECESAISTPTFASATPNLAQPGQPIFAQVAFNEVFPMQTVWANGIPLVRTQQFGLPFWVGTIPADTRPGPQTVYFFGKDTRGVAATYIALYTVQAPASQHDFEAQGLEITQVSAGRYDLQPVVQLTVATTSTGSVPVDYQILVNNVVRYDSRTHTVALNAGCAGPGCAGACALLVHGTVYAGDCIVRGTNCYCQAKVRLWKAEAIALVPGDSVKLVLDPSNTVPELDEANNTYQTTPLFITSVSLTTSLNFSWAGGIGPFQIQCKDNFEQAEWRIVQTTLGRSATLPRTGARAFYRIYDEATGVQGLNVFTSQPLYIPNQAILTTVESTRGGVLTVDVFDPKKAEGSNNVVFHQSLTIPAPPLGSVAQRSFSFSTGQEGRYVVVAQLASSTGDPLDNATTSFGVRSAALTALPPEILRTEVATLNVPSIRTALRNAAATGQPAQVQLGSNSVVVQSVQRLLTFDPDPGAQLPPDLVGLETYQGQVLGESNSIVVLNVGPSGPGGDDLNGMILMNSQDLEQSALWVEPLSLYVSNASPSVHLVYRGEDVLPIQDVHLPIADPRDAQPPGSNNLAGASFEPAGHTVSKTVRLRVYEHYVNSTRTHRRCSIIYCWGAIVRNEFQNILPRASTAHRLTVSSVVISWWQSIPTTGYGGGCSAELAKFRNDFDTVDNRLYILFTTLGSGCGGIAYLGQGTRTRWHCIVRDTSSSFDYNTVILGQEVGHNWDWHSTWAGPPHDAHLCGCISEQWNHKHGWWIFSWNHRHCTMMRASYGSCQQAELRYHRASGDALRHLGEGIWRYH